MKKILSVGLFCLVSVIVAAPTKVIQLNTQKKLLPKDQFRLNKKLFHYAKKGNDKKVNELLSKGADSNWLEQRAPEEWDFSEDSDLFSDSFSDDEEEISEKVTILHAAHPNCVLSLIRAGANIRAQSQGPKNYSVFTMRLGLALEDEEKSYTEILQYFFKSIRFLDGLNDQELIQAVQELKALYEEQDMQENLKEKVKSALPPAVFQTIYSQN